MYELDYGTFFYSWCIILCSNLYLSPMILSLPLTFLWPALFVPLRVSLLCFHVTNMILFSLYLYFKNSSSPLMTPFLVAQLTHTYTRMHVHTNT